MYATDVEGSTVVSSAEIYTNDRPAIPLQISCPTVAAPNIPYSCAFASIPGTGDLSIKYGGVFVNNLQKLDLPIVSLGNIPPRKLQVLDPQIQIQTPVAGLQPTILANGRADSYLKIAFVEWLAFGGIGIPEYPLKVFVSCQLISLTEKGRPSGAW